MDIRYDCRHYRGLKPCGKCDSCDGCTAFEPMGKRILIIKLGAMGDVLRTTPVLRALRQQMSPCHITWLTAPESIVLLKYNPFIDRLLEWNFESALMLQAQEFDLVLNFEKEPGPLALDALIKAREKKGFALTRWGTLGVHNAASGYALELGINDDLKFHRNEKPMPRILFEMAELEFRGEEYVLEIGDGARAFGEKFIGDNGLRGKHPIIGLNTGCGAVFPTKQWPLENFVELVRELKAQTQATLILLGGMRENNFNAELLDQSPQGALIDTGCDNSLEEFMGLLNQCDLVVSADSLAMHIAIALHRQVVALIGPTSITEIDLYGRGVKLSSNLECAPCYGKSCSQEINCMRELGANLVLREISKIINAKL